MSLRLRAKIAVPSVIMLVVVGASMPGDAQDRNRDEGRSPALCGPDDIPEPGIQGDVPAGATANYNCGLTLVGRIPRAGALQGAGHCAYVRSGAAIFVIDVSDPANPTEIGSVPSFGGSETMRAVVTDERAVLVSGRGVYDISDCENPVVKGEIQWPRVEVLGVPFNLLPHDLRINHAGTKVYASFGMWEADLTDLDDPTTWTVTNHHCDLLEQFNPIHMQAAAAGVSLCVPGATTVTLGANSVQAALLWPPLSHGPDTNGADTRLYVGDVAGGLSGVLQEGVPLFSIIDLTQDPPRILDQAAGAGHSVDWFRTADGREFVLHANEFGIPAQQPVPGDTCVPERKRPESLGWAFEAFVTEVTRDNLRRRSSLELAINSPRFCEAKRASGRNTTIAYHSIDNPSDANFAMVSFGDAGLRVFDIRNPRSRSGPSEVAYFNHGPLVHAANPHYDASRGLIYVPGSDGFKVLQIQHQVLEHLGLDE